MGDRLKEVTYLTIKDLKNNEIVLPGEYSKTFENFAKDCEIDIDNQEVILKNINQNTKHIDQIVKKTSESLDTIQCSAQKAQKAIKEKDEKSLDEINKELEDMQKQINFLQKELFSDGLTGAYNRKWFSDYYLSEEVFPEAGKLAFLDLNKFKTINDSFGHMVGDQVLKYLVKFLKKELAEEGIHVIRYAGDEFLILFSENILPKMDIREKMNDVQKKLSNQKLKSAKIDVLQFSFSYGLVKYNKGADLAEVLDKADELMYDNKQKNR